MTLTGLLFVCVAGIVHHLGPDLPSIEAAFIRYAFGILLLAPSLRRLFQRRTTAHLWRLSIARGMMSPRVPSRRTIQ